MSYLFIGLQGTEISAEEAEYLVRPEVGGVVLFARNGTSPAAVSEVVRKIRAVRADLIITIDQEGGRVQRVKESPCAPLPPLRRLGKCFDEDPDEGLHLTYQHGFAMAREMALLGVDMSFAPVLDIDGGCAVIGDRAFHGNADAVKDLSRAYIKGMHAGGLPACAKHFPGHGSVREDTHLEKVVDDRSFSDIAITDLKPFTAAIRQGVDSVMMSHVVYPQVDSVPAGFSSKWIQEILRERIGFDGVVITDDLGMQAAAQLGGLQDRLVAALAAGCDVALVCEPEHVAEIMRCDLPPPQTESRVERLRDRTNLVAPDTDSGISAAYADDVELELARAALEELSETN